MIPKIVGFNRNIGKTTELIKIASKRNLYIICADRDRAHYIEKLARKMELSIPYPVTVEELPLRSPYIKEVLVDDVEDVLSKLIGKYVFAMSTSYPYQDLEEEK